VGRQVQGLQPSVLRAHLHLHSALLFDFGGSRELMGRFTNLELIWSISEMYGSIIGSLAFWKGHGKDLDHRYLREMK
jgi:hypothetical protein